MTHRQFRLDSLLTIQSHRWFQSFNESLSKNVVSNSASPLSSLWLNIRGLPYSPPFVPEITSELDHQHFDDFENFDAAGMDLYREVHAKQKQADSDMEEGTGQIENSRHFFPGFSFRHKDAVGWRVASDELERLQHTGTSRYHGGFNK